MSTHKHHSVIKEFPFKQTFSFVPLIIYWKKRTKSKNVIEATYAQNIIENLNKSLDLFDNIDDHSVIENNRPLVDAMLTALISPHQFEKDLFGISMPYFHLLYYSTPGVEKIFGKYGKSFLEDLFRSKNEEINYFGPTLHAYGRILKEYYDADTQFTIPIMSVNKFDEELKIVRSYEVKVDHSFVNIEPTKKLKKLSEKEIIELRNNFYDLDLWFKTLPPENFEMRGFATNYMAEVTQQQSISSLKDNLLDKDAIISKTHFAKLERRMCSLLKLPELKLGIAIFTLEGTNFLDYLRTWQSILPNPELMCECYFRSVYEEAVKSERPVVISDLESHPNPSKIELALIKAGYKSIIIAPLFFEDKLVGALELASPNKNDLNPISNIKIFETLPLFSNAASRVTLEMDNRIKAKIQEEFTAIHPIVEWRFIEEASGLLRKERGDENFEKEDIIFKEVYPLFGAADIRSSSHERNKAILIDLSEQLNNADDVLKHIYNLRKLPVLNQIRHEITVQLKKLSKGLTAGDEMRIIDFIKREVDPIFKHLKETDPGLKDIITDYEKKNDPDQGILYKRRSDFETSLDMINDSITTIIDSQENSAQEMFPHYFEKYRTDGIEYNIYMGQSLLENKKFDTLYLKNLRLWQLIVTCQTGRSIAKLKTKLPIPLEITQLILVHSNPLSIKFREDEKKFDVEGGYNIRYEITKKRIDKAVIKGTNERISKPGTIAIIYSQHDELLEYQKYIDYLISINYLTNKLENFELEDMQGVFGLKALRVEINLKSVDMKDLDNMEKIANEALNIEI
jgi:hypothetical protein